MGVWIFGNEVAFIVGCLYTCMFFDYSFSYDLDF